MENNFEGLEYEHILRGRNEEADELAKIGSSRGVIPLDVFLHRLDQPSIKKEISRLTGSAEFDGRRLPTTGHQDSEVMIIEGDWRTPFIEYLRTGTLPENRSTADKLHRQAARYALVGNELYRRGVSGVLMKCIPVEDGIAILQDIHSGSCGNHAGARMLVGKVYRQGFYWPTTFADAKTLVRKCEGCQFFARQQYVPSGQLQTIPMT